MTTSNPCASVNDSAVSITVCVPVYNVEQYLKECLDSIFSQEYPYFDVVMVDDGSTDNSGAICDEYAVNNAWRTIVIHKENEGLLLARRDAFAQATGEYVMCVDSDDMLIPGAIETVASIISKTGADVVRYGFTRDTDEISSGLRDAPYRYYSYKEKPKMLRAICSSTSGSENPMWFKAIHRDCVGLDFDFSPFKGMTFAEDFLQSLTVYDRAKTFCFTDAKLYFYRPGSGITRAYCPHFYRDVCRCLDVAEDFASRWEIEYPSCDDLLEGLATCRIDSAAQYAEWMAIQEDEVGLNSLRYSEDLIRCLSLASNLSGLRADRRLAIFALRSGHYSILRLLSKIREVVRSLK